MDSRTSEEVLFATTVLFSFVVVVVVIVFTIVSSMKRLSNGETVSGFSSRSSRSVNHRI